MPEEQAWPLYFFVAFGVLCVFDWLRNRLTPRH